MDAGESFKLFGEIRWRAIQIKNSNISKWHPFQFPKKKLCTWWTHFHACLEKDKNKAGHRAELNLTDFLTCASWDVLLFLKVRKVTAYIAATLETKQDSRDQFHKVTITEMLLSTWKQSQNNYSVIVSCYHEIIPVTTMYTHVKHRTTVVKIDREANFFLSRVATMRFSWK